jgi:hypothetical protein
MVEATKCAHPLVRLHRALSLVKPCCSGFTLHLSSWAGVKNGHTPSWSPRMCSNFPNTPVGMKTTYFALDQSCRVVLETDSTSHCGLPVWSFSIIGISWWEFDIILELMTRFEIPHVHLRSWEQQLWTSTSRANNKGCKV